MLILAFFGKEYGLVFLFWNALTILESIVLCFLLPFMLSYWQDKKKEEKQLKRKDKKARWVALLLVATFSILSFTAFGISPIESYAQPEVSANYPIVSLTRNGTPMYRKGMLVDGEVYVHTYLFIRNFSSATYTQKGNTLTVSASGLTVVAVAGQPYILANDRVVYTGKNAMFIDGALCVPLRALAKAMGLSMTQNGNTLTSLTGQYRPLLHADRFYREDEVYWLSKIISAESKGEPLLGQIAVGNVILNRVKSPAFPNTIYSVIFDKKYGVQFTPTQNGTIYQKPYDISVVAAKICLEGYDMGNILYFYHPAYPGQTNWISNNRRYAFTINGHQFYY